MRCKDCLCYADGLCNAEPPSKTGQRFAVKMNPEHYVCRNFLAPIQIPANLGLERQLKALTDKLPESHKLLKILEEISINVNQ